MSKGAQKASRAALLLCGLLSLILIVSPAGADDAPRTDAGISIVNGKATSIEEWPWQVAITFARSVAPRSSTTRRFFCGGAGPPPRLVITAGHCVADFTRSQIRKLEVVSGRTRLNAATGQIARVTGVRMPVTSSGKRRYVGKNGAANWDVALLTLASSLSAQPIKLAGDDEFNLWAPGRLAWSTGWGITKGNSERVSNNLRVATQVMMNDGLCRRADGVAYRPETMNCLGGPRGNSSACSGDSGGPLVVNSSDGYRLAGLTSFGDGACRGFIPSVDTRVSGDAIRSWVEKVSMEISGVDVSGSAASGPPVRTWCRVPDLFGLTVSRARKKLEDRGCRLGRVSVDRYSGGPRRRVVGITLVPGWLTPPGNRIHVWIAP
ncbi:MAG TPA: trypsin-like serine protease [Solirubrobacterales bacterium]|nr:trypsin-like serine protease [Solirubrobacterales bacterium]